MEDWSKDLSAHGSYLVHLNLNLATKMKISVMMERMTATKDNNCVNEILRIKTLLI